MEGGFRGCFISEKGVIVCVVSCEWDVEALVGFREI